MPHSALFLPEEKRSVHPCSRNRDEFNRQEHAAHDGFRSRRREDEIHAEKLRRLRRWCLPWREYQGKDQKNDHSIEYGDIELPWSRGRMLLRRRRDIRSTGEPATALNTETVDLRL